MKLNWICKTFDDLNNNELYDLMVLRQEVFVVEQNCAYLDADGKDKYSYHVLGYDETGKPAACARIVYPGVSYKEVSIGRVASALLHRRTGVGKELMNETIKAIENIYGNVPVRISAQTYLVKFYSEFGFASTGKEYMEDGIPHTEMLKP